MSFISLPFHIPGMKVLYIELLRLTMNQNHQISGQWSSPCCLNQPDEVVWSLVNAESPRLYRSRERPLADVICNIAEGTKDLPKVQIIPPVSVNLGTDPMWAILFFRKWTCVKRWALVAPDRDGFKVSINWNRLLALFTVTSVYPRVHLKLNYNVSCNMFVNERSPQYIRDETYLVLEYSLSIHIYSWRFSYLPHPAYSLRCKSFDGWSCSIPTAPFYLAYY